MRKSVAVSLMLIAACFLTFGGALRHDFVHYDDNLYVMDNPRVQEGLTWDNLRWAFTARFDANWFPLTLISHLLDGTLYGPNPAGHHFTSLLLHALNAVLVFWVLRRFTGQWIPAALVAAAFALHPLRVESVAWVSERKDVLCAFFGLLTLLTYERWVRRPSVGRYAVICIFFALGLLSKPMLVTLPFVMLLLDVWPLGRAQSNPPLNPLQRRGNYLTSPPPEGYAKRGVGFSAWRPLLVEKLPLFLLAAVSSYITYRVQQAGGAVQTFDEYPLAARAANALVSYAEYVRLLFWPANLAFYYPHPGAEIVWIRTIIAALFLAVITAGALRWRDERPYLIVGWLWYLGMLLPVIGLVQVGGQALADRYTYLPHIGLLIMIAWGAREISNFEFRISNPVRGSAVLLVLLLILVLAILAHRQTLTWRDSETLFLRAIAVTRDNAVAHHNLGAWYGTQKRWDEALPHLRRSLEIKPDYVDAHHNIANVYMLTGHPADAIRHYRAAVTLHPHHAMALNNLAWLLATSPDSSTADREEAFRHAHHVAFTVGLQNPATLNTLAATLAALDQYEDAIRVATAAWEQARASGDDEMVRRIQQRLDSYRQRVPSSTEHHDRRRSR